jgi:hypothetical protein
VFATISNNDPKVFGIGLSRTGTTSLNKALTILGYKAFHWRLPYDYSLLRLEHAYFMDAITDINASFQFETLYHVFPKAKFVYTTRPQAEWTPSICEHYDAKSPGALAWRLAHAPVVERPAGPNAERHTALFHAMHHALYTQHQTWEAAYAAHDRRVRSFFADRPESMLEFDIFEAGHGWPELCTFLGKPIPDVPYPRQAWKPKISADGRDG